MVESPNPRLPFSGVDESLSGLVERVTFHSEETGFSVLRVKARGRRQPAVVVGHTASVSPGEWLEARGHWQSDPVHGPQFRARELATAPPTTRAGMLRYLSSGLIRGVGPGLAERLVEAFGDGVFEVIDVSPERLREVRGVGEVRAERIVAGWAAQKRIREIMLFLHSHGVSTGRAVRIHRVYGNAAVALIRADPYRLARDIRGIGFASADALAADLGIAKNAPSRIRAGLLSVLAQALTRGHCGLPEESLMEGAEALLGVARERVREALDREIHANTLVRSSVADRSCVFLPSLAADEESAAQRLRELAAGEPPWPRIDVPAALDWVEAQLGLALAPSQREALQIALGAKGLVLTGGPGVGKTTLVNALLEILSAKGVRALLAAPTGRAAKRLSEASGREASTIHRLLETNPGIGGFKRGADHPLDCDLVVIDESSMIDVPLLAALVRAIPRRAALLLIGDVDQLPSVGPGQVLADCIESGALPVVRLREVFRQAEESAIVQSAHRINRGELPDLHGAGDGDFFFIEVDAPELAAERLVKVVADRIPQRFGLDPVRDVQVLSPMHRGALGARSLNVGLQAALNPLATSGAKVEAFGSTLAVGDKVMQIENDYDREVYNGDLGFVVAIDDDAREMRVEIDGRSVPYAFDELDSLVLAYAITVHKSQGSEYPAVVVPLSTQHYPMLERRLLYTAVTRGRQLVVLVGQRRALSIAVQGRGEGPRCSTLLDRLRDA